VTVPVLASAFLAAVPVAGQFLVKVLFSKIAYNLLKG